MQYFYTLKTSFFTVFYFFSLIDFFYILHYNIIELFYMLYLVAMFEFKKAG